MDSVAKDTSAPLEITAAAAVTDLALDLVLTDFVQPDMPATPTTTVALSEAALFLGFVSMELVPQDTNVDKVISATNLLEPQLAKLENLRKIPNLLFHPINSWY